VRNQHQDMVAYQTSKIWIKDIEISKLGGTLIFLHF